jgi:hypothetical protein
MWTVRKAVMNAKRVIVNQDWECGEEGRALKGTTLYTFLDTVADLANNETGQMCCGILRIMKATSLSRSAVIRCLEVARRHRFMVDTGARLPAPYDTIVYQMEPRVFRKLAHGYLDTSYGSIEAIRGDLDLDYEQAARLYFEHEVRRIFMNDRDYPDDEEWYRRVMKFPQGPEAMGALMESRRLAPETAGWTASQRRNAFVRVGKEMLDKPAPVWVPPTFEIQYDSVLVQMG